MIMGKNGYLYEPKLPVEWMLLIWLIWQML